jgi:hypothetical protein
MGLDEDFAVFSIDLEFGGYRDDGAGMSRGKMAPQLGKGVEVLGVDGAPEIGYGCGRRFSCACCFGWKRQTGPESAACDDNARALEKIPSAESASFVIVVVFIGHNEPSLEFRTDNSFYQHFMDAVSPSYCKLGRSVKRMKKMNCQRHERKIFLYT